VRGGRMTKRAFKLIALILIMALLFVGCTDSKATVKDDEDLNPGIEIVEGEVTEENGEVEENNQEEVGDNPDKIQENIVYISASKLNVRDNPKDGKVIGGVIKGKGVKVLDEYKGESGEALWYKIEFDNNGIREEGWISAEYTVKDKMDLLGDAYKELDLSPQRKADEYPGNPRVEVKGVYVTIHTAANALNRLDKLIEFANETEINAFIIDVKDDHGTMLFPTKAAEKYGTDANKGATIKDIEAFM